MPHANKLFRSAALGLLSFALVGACALEEDPLEAGLDDVATADPEPAEPRLGTLARGRRLNTNHIGTHFFSELALDRTPHQDTRLIEISYAGTTEVLTESIHVVDGELWGMRADGVSMRHTDFGATTWLVEIAQPGPWGFLVWSTYALTVEATADPATGMPLYIFRYDDGVSEDLVSTCPLTDQGPELTAAVLGDLHVDDVSGTMMEAPGILYIGCLAGAVGKSASWGYAPYYLTTTYGILGLQLFEASVRMLRADFCGDGQSWTVPGTGIYIDDKVGNNAAIPLAGLWGQPLPLGEAVWGLNGAICLDTPRTHKLANQPPITCSNGVWLWPCWAGASTMYADPNMGAWFRTASDP